MHLKMAIQQKIAFIIGTPVPQDGRGPAEKLRPHTMVYRKKASDSAHAGKVGREL
jgi:hypothetical protein